MFLNQIIEIWTRKSGLATRPVGLPLGQTWTGSHWSKPPMEEEGDTTCVPIRSLSSAQSDTIEIITIRKVCPNSINIDAYSNCDLVFSWFQVCVATWLRNLVHPAVLCVLLLLPQHQKTKCKDSNFAWLECFFNLASNGTCVKPKAQNSVKCAYNVHKTNTFILSPVNLNQKDIVHHTPSKFHSTVPHYQSPSTSLLCVGTANARGAAVAV